MGREAGAVRVDGHARGLTRPHWAQPLTPSPAQRPVGQWRAPPCSFGLRLARVASRLPGSSPAPCWGSPRDGSPSTALGSPSARSWGPWHLLCAGALASEGCRGWSPPVPPPALEPPLPFRAQVLGTSPENPSNEGQGSGCHGAGSRLQPSWDVPRDGEVSLGTWAQPPAAALLIPLLGVRQLLTKSRLDVCRPVRLSPACAASCPLVKSPQKRAASDTHPNPWFPGGLGG